MAVLDAAALKKLSDSDFAYIDSNGGRHLPIHDEEHIRAAMARFNQTQFESSAAKQAARAKILAAAKKAGIDASGFAEAKSAEPEMEYKALPFSAESGDDLEPNEFKGYVAAFNSVDSEGDIIVPGAFKEGLPEFLERGVICYQHDIKEPIGRPLEAKEDNQGLFIKARISDTQKGRDVLTLMRDGVIKRLSFGYKAVGKKALDDAEGVALLGHSGYKSAMDALPWNRHAIRALTKLQLFEGSPVTLAANSDAVITGVKGMLPAGMTFDDHFSAVRAANEEFTARFRDLAGLRVKAGRVLSAGNVSKLSDVRDQIMQQLEVIDQLLDSVLPPDEDQTAQKAAEQVAEFKAALLAERARFLRTEAHLIGAL